VTELKYDPQGLIPAVAQDRFTGKVRMVAWMNREALERTLATGRATFFSRSREALWVKGESSGNHLHVSAVHADCDADVLLLSVEAAGPSCHTGRPTCFFRRLSSDGTLSDSPHEATAFLEALGAEIHGRAGSTAGKSYTKSLLDGGTPKLADKLTEEAGELAVALQNESDDRVKSEAADLLYHLLVSLELRGLDFTSVIEVLARRAGTSGHAEKAARSPLPGDDADS
jgi:phosphoribosyl-ATP pyrophosphohydrolase/phosphoribosyl-AMP cyclohydrolase